jgi:hypothetical protein
MIMSVESEKELATRELRAKMLGLTLAQYDLAEAVPTSVVRGIVSDAYKPRVQSSIIPKKDGDAPPRGTLAMERPLGVPAGIDHIDRMCAAQDRNDMIERITRIVEAIKRLGG